jgi:hypothetical protein
MKNLSTIKGYPRLSAQYLIIFVITITVYIITLAPGLLWQDSGGLQLRLVNNELFYKNEGIERLHALYVFSAWVVSIIVQKNWAFGANLTSALFGALTLSNCPFAEKTG